MPRLLIRRRLRTVFGSLRLCARRTKRRALLTNVYVDGFNLYHRAVEDTPYKWLDLRRLAKELFPSDEIQRIHYFTSRLVARPNRPKAVEEGQQARQNAYIRALGTVRGVSVHYGNYLIVNGKRSPEKKTDVNLATRLVADGFKRDYEQAAIVSQDTDFVAAIACVRDEIGLPIVLVNPDYYKEPLYELREAATRVIRIRKSHLEACQLEPVVYDANGAVRKPAEWE